MVSKHDELTAKGLFDTASLMLAVVAGIWEAHLFQDYMILLYEIEAAVSAPPLLVFAILATFRKGPAFTFAKLLLKGLTWSTALLAGNLFTTGYSYISSFVWPYGPLWFAFYFLFVAAIISAINIMEYRLDVRKKSGRRHTTLRLVPFSSENGVPGPSKSTIDTMTARENISGDVPGKVTVKERSRTLPPKLWHPV